MPNNNINKDAIRKIDSFDYSYKGFFANPGIFYSLLTDIIHYPYKLDMSYSQAPLSIYYNKNKQEVRDDIIWRVKLKGYKARYVDFIVEQQSYLDDLMPIRMGGYKYSYFNAAADRGLYTPDKRFYPVILIVIYNGRRKWNVKTNVRDLIMLNSKNDSKYDFNSYYEPGLEYILADISHFDVYHLPNDSLIRPLVTIEQAKTRKSLCKGIEEAIRLYSDDKFGSVRERLRYLILNASYIRKNIDEEVIRNIITLEGVHAMLAENLDIFEKKLIRKGEKKGERKAEKKYKNDLNIAKTRNDTLTAEKSNAIKKLVNYCKENGKSFDESSAHISFIYEMPLDDAKNEVKKYWD